MGRPRQTPHLPMSSAQQKPENAGHSDYKRGGAPPPIGLLIQITLKIWIFHFHKIHLPLNLHLSSHFTKSD
nr:putative disease resistance protein [Dalbergia sissoo]